MKFLKYLIPLLLISNICFASASRDWDGATGRVDVGSASVLDNLGSSGGAITMAAWIFPDTAGEGGAGRILDKAAANDGTGGWFFRTIATGAGRCGSGAASASFVFRTTNNSNYPTGFWTFAVCTWDGSVTATNINMYANGTNCTYSGATNGTAPASADGANNLYIGQRAGGDDRTFDGRMGYDQVFSSILTSVQINEIMWKPEMFPETKKGFWPIWGDSPEMDLSGNGSTGSVTGTSTNQNGGYVMFGGGLPL